MPENPSSTAFHKNLTLIRWFGLPLHNPRRGVPVAALLVTAAAHIPVIPAHLREAPYVGVLFILLVAGSLLMAAVLAMRDAKAAYNVTAVMMALALASYVISRIVGLPLIGDDVGNWLEPLGVVSITVELIALTACGSIALSAKSSKPAPARTSTGPQVGRHRS